MVNLLTSCDSNGVTMMPSKSTSNQGILTKHRVSTSMQDISDEFFFHKEWAKRKTEFMRS